jgi:hypothetical protein
MTLCFIPYWGGYDSTPYQFKWIKYKMSKILYVK